MEAGRISGDCQAGQTLWGSVFFVDESTVPSDYHSGTTWAPVGQTPVVETTGGSLQSEPHMAISPRCGQLRFMCFEGSFKIPVYVDFVRRLILDANSPVFLIADGHPVHRCKAIRKLAAESDDRLCLFFLPATHRAMNSDELVWGYLKHHKIGKLPVKGVRVSATRSSRSSRPRTAVPSSQWAASPVRSHESVPPFGGMDPVSLANQAAA
jgi:hypothetical protein